MCDGSHSGTSFKPMAWTASEDTTAYMCGCKHTKNQPMCDGSHAALPDVEELEKPVVAKKGPFPVDVKAGETYYYCTCGKSKSQPMCDGSHSGTSFKPMAWTASEDTTAYMCGCKHTKNQPMCDGSHAALPDVESFAQPVEDYKPYVVTAVETVAASVVKLTLECGSLDLGALLDGRGSHFYIKANASDGKEHVRPYTPFVYPGVTDKFVFVVKVYPNGVVGTKLASLVPGDMLEMMGPTVGAKYNMEKVTRFGLVAGGSGITPMFNVIYAHIKWAEEANKPLPAISLIYCNRKEEDIIMKAELDALSAEHPGFKVTYALSQPAQDSGFWLKGRVSKEMMREHLPSPDGEQTFLCWCGPPGFNDIVECLAKDLGYENTYQFG